MVPRMRFPTLARRASAAAAAALSLAACSDFLKVTNPGRIEVGTLEKNAPAYTGLLVNGVIGEFQPTFANDALYAGLFSDELRNHHVFFENRDIDKRTIAPENGTYRLFIYAPLHRTRFLADSAVGRFRVILGDSASSDIRVARILAYGGYTYTLIGEQLCGSPIDGGPLLSSDSLLKIGVARFNEAIRTAEAYRASVTAAASRQVADSILAFARVGAARASLNLNDKAQAITYASAVPAGFEFRAYYSENTAREYQPFRDAMSAETAGSNRFVSASNTPFEALRTQNDPRVPFGPTTEVVQGGLAAWVPNATSAFSQYTGTLPGGEISRTGFMRVASKLEADYIVAEAQGPTAATLAFVNARRAVGQQPAVALAGDALMADLREQRKRDFYMNGQRLGDMRRYKRYYNVDEYQRGAYPGTTTGEVYGPQECFPLTLNELLYNPGARPTG